MKQVLLTHSPDGVYGNGVLTCMLYPAVWTAHPASSATVRFRCYLLHLLHRTCDFFDFSYPYGVELVACGDGLELGGAAPLNRHHHLMLPPSGCRMAIESGMCAGVVVGFVFSRLR